MKAKLTRSYDIGQGVTLMSGTEVEIISVMPIPASTACVVEIDGYGKRIIDTGYLNVDESYLVPDWEQRRYEIAKECVAVLMSGEMTLEDAAKLSVEQADALIIELKKRPAIIEVKSQVVDRANHMSLEKNRLEIQNLEVRTKVSQ